MDAVYPATTSALARGRRQRRAQPPDRRRTTPVTFAEIKEVDEESCEAMTCEEGGGDRAAAGARRQPDVLQERLGAQFAEFRRRRAGNPRAAVLREAEPAPAPNGGAVAPPGRDTAAALPRAGSEPAALHRAHTSGPARL